MGLVAPVEGPCAWRGQDIANSERWIRDLQPEHIGEIDAALAMVENRGIDWREITATDFPLPGLTDLIGQIRKKLWGQALHFTSVTNGPVNCKA